ncbi:uncharacterized protein LOC117640788 [Thrips palmi]|uniref:Uncharacterized protein LOC117640788 n=1 Tax=Thrips palmi TaxID=161013 RepID=A0A6P8YHU9_THRPL|nr:uncharacterized protein LOC117640788 [Thrips palmi]
MAAPMSMSFVETVNRIYKFLGSDDLIVDETAVFQEPRLSRQDTDKCDIGLPLITLGGCDAIIPGALLFPEYKQFKLKINLKQVLEELPPRSISWALPIQSCSTFKNSLCVSFDRQQVYRNTIFSILFVDSTSVKLLGSKKVVCVTKDTVSVDQDITDLTELRVALAYESICKVFIYLGYDVKKRSEEEVTSSDFRRLHVCHKQICSEKVLGCSLVHCGAVLNMTTGSKDSNTSVKEYYRRKKLVFERMAKARSNCQGSSDQAATISEAEVTGELLWVKLHDNVSISLSDEDSAETGVSHGATFLLYNHVRLSCIRRKFEQGVESGLYQKLPDIEDIDFGLLTQNEEWQLLLLILEFPYWLINCICPRGKISLHPVLVGLDKLCRVFSVYYRRVRVLMEPRPQLLPIMYARLYLLQCVEHILGTGLSIFGMKPLDSM